jgi:hypothetical protein
MMDELEYAQAHVLYVIEGAGIKPGSFTHKLIEAFLRADRENFYKLSKEYSIIAQAVDDYRNGELTHD